MANITLISIYERHVKARTKSFKSWCEFISWVRKVKPDTKILAALEELTPEAYDALRKPSQPLKPLTPSPGGTGMAPASTMTKATTRDPPPITANNTCASAGGRKAPRTSAKDTPEKRRDN